MSSTNMKTRENTKLWLFDKCIPECDLDGGDITFKGKLPPTGEDVYLVFRGYQQHLQENNNGKYTNHDAAKQTAEKLMVWWDSAGIPTKQFLSIVKDIKKRGIRNGKHCIQKEK